MRRREDLDISWLLAALFLVVVLPADVGGQEWIVAPSPSPEQEERAPRIAKPPEDLFSINGAFLGALQWIAKSDDARGSVFGAARWRHRHRAPQRLHTHLSRRPGVIGPGPDQELGTLSRVNKRGTTSRQGQTLRLMKLILRPSWLEERVLLASASSTWRTTSTATRSPRTRRHNSHRGSAHQSDAEAAAERPGTASAVTVGDWRYGFGVHGLDDVDGDQSGCRS